MKLDYYFDTDSIHIDLSEETSVESREVSEGIVLDYDADGNLIGIDIDKRVKRSNSKFNSEQAAGSDRNYRWVTSALQPQERRASLSA